MKCLRYFTSCKFLADHSAKLCDRLLRFYRAMHLSAKRGIEIACRLSVCNVGGSGPHRLENLET